MRLVIALLLSFPDCETGGYLAERGSGLQYMVAPLFHCEAVVTTVRRNNFCNTHTASFGVNGAYNALSVDNVAYRRPTSACAPSRLPSSNPDQLGGSGVGPSQSPGGRGRAASGGCPGRGPAGGGAYPRWRDLRPASRR